MLKTGAYFSGMSPWPLPNNCNKKCALQCKQCGNLCAECNQVVHARSVSLHRGFFLNLDDVCVWNGGRVDKEVLQAHQRCPVQSSTEACKTPLCGIHGVPVDILCHDDQQLVCNQCYIKSAGTHPGHDVTNLKEVAGRLIQKVSLFLQEALEPFTKMSANMQCKEGLQPAL